MHDVEGPQEMFHLEDTPLQWGAASHAASHEAVTHQQQRAVRGTEPCCLRWVVWKPSGAEPRRERSAACRQQPGR